MKLLDNFFYNRKLRRELRSFLEGGRDITPARLVSTTALWVPSLDTALYSVRRWDNATGGYIYAPWDWSRSKEVAACNIVKASQGLAPDPFYYEHVATMRAAGIPYGSYLFNDPIYSAIAQANVFCNECEHAGGYGFVIAIDCERRPASISPGAYMAALGSMVNEIDKRKPSSVQIIIYSRASFWDAIWINAGRPVWTRTIPQWQAAYPAALQTDAARRAILYNGWVPTFPASAMQGLGARWGFQYTPHIANYLIPGHNMVKAEEDGSLWLRASIPTPSFPTTPPLTLEEQVADHETRITHIEGQMESWSRI